MALLKPDPTFYPSPRMAMQGPKEKLAYVALLNTTGAGRHDAMTVVDLSPESATYGPFVGNVEMRRCAITLRAQDTSGVGIVDGQGRTVLL